MGAKRQYRPYGTDEAVGVCELLYRSLNHQMWQHPLRFGGKSLQSLSEAKNCFREKHLKCKLRAVPSCRCQIAHNHYQTERDLTLDCTQQDRRQNTKSIWQVKLLLQPMIFQQGAQHHRCQSLTFASMITPDCERYDFRNTADIFSIPIRESMLNSFMSHKTFMVHSQNGKKASRRTFSVHSPQKWTITTSISVSSVVKSPSTCRRLGLLTLTHTKCQHSTYYYYK